MTGRALHVSLLELEPLPDDLGEKLAEALPPPFAATTLLREDAPLSPCYDAHRNQLDASQVLGLLPSPPQGHLVLGLLKQDLFVSVLTYVFGLSELGGGRGVLSVHRLSYADPQGDGGALLRRLTIEAVHELGHTVGLPHCAVAECAMKRTMWPEAIELKRPALCPSCFIDAASWRIGREDSEVG